MLIHDRSVPAGVLLRTGDTTKKKGEGVLLDLGIHAVDNAWFIMGCPQPTEISAELYCHFSSLVPADQIYAADDAACGQIRFKNGSVLHFAVAFSLNTANEEIPNGENIFRTELQDIKIYGTLGGIENERLLIGTPTGVKVNPLNTIELSADPVTLQSREFIRAVTERDQPLTPTSEAVMLINARLGHEIKPNRESRTNNLNRWADLVVSDCPQVASTE